MTRRERMNNNQNLIDGLREFADFLEDRPELMDLGLVRVNGFVSSVDNLRTQARIMGTHKKVWHDGGWFILRREFGENGVRLDININREQLCERVATTIEVPEQVIPALKEIVIPAHTEEKVEWKCPEDFSVLAAKEEA